MGMSPNTTYTSRMIMFRQFIGRVMLFYTIYLQQ